MIQLRKTDHSNNKEMVIVMKIVQGDLFNYAENGYIIHQVNCQNDMASGFAKAFFTKFPKIKTEYHKECQKFINENKPIINHLQYVQLTDDLIGVNSFTQEYYGNAAKTGRNYTDEEALINNIGKVLDRANSEDKKVYIPEKIGCALAGGNWDNVLSGIGQFDTSNLTIVSFR